MEVLRNCSDTTEKGAVTAVKKKSLKSCQKGSTYSNLSGVLIILDTTVCDQCGFI